MTCALAFEYWELCCLFFENQLYLPPAISDTPHWSVIRSWAHDRAGGNSTLPYWQEEVRKSVPCGHCGLGRGTNLLWLISIGAMAPLLLSLHKYSLKFWSRDVGPIFAGRVICLLYDTRAWCLKITHSFQLHTYLQQQKLSAERSLARCGTQSRNEVQRLASVVSRLKLLFGLSRREDDWENNPYFV